MSQLNDAQHLALITQGFSGAHNEMMIDWAQANGATSDQENTAIVEALLASTATSSNPNTAWREVLISLGYTGALPNMLQQFWSDGGNLPIPSGEFQGFKVAANNLPAGHSATATVWGTPSNALVSDDNYADFGLFNTAPIVVSRYLGLTGLVRPVPAGVTITGITVRLENISTFGSIQDESIILLRNYLKAAGSDDKSLGAPWSAIESVISYGGIADTWTASLTAADVNSDGFGVSIAVDNTGGTGVGLDLAEIDYISIAIHYS